MSSSLRLLRRDSSTDRGDVGWMPKLPHVIKRDANHFIDRCACFLQAKNLIILFGFFLYTFLLLYISGSHALEHTAKYPKAGNVVYRSLDDYDVGCNGYPMDYRIEEQKRILSSVRSELIQSSKKLEEVNSVIDSLNRQIPEKQQELASIADEIEMAERTLVELRDRRNVRVYLPHAPLVPKQVANVPLLNNASTHSLDDFLDYSRCSISSFLPVYVAPSDTPNSVIDSFYSEIKRTVNQVSTVDQSCIVISVVNGTRPALLSQNHLVFNLGNPLSPGPGEIVVQGGLVRRYIDHAMYVDVPEHDAGLWKTLSPLLPYTRKFLLTVILDDESQLDAVQLDTDLTRLRSSADASADQINIVRCRHRASLPVCIDESKRDLVLRSSMFCLLTPSPRFQQMFWESLRAGCVPMVLSMDQPLPLEEVIDWRLASYRMPAARLPEVHFVARSLEMADVLEMRRRGRTFFQQYLGDRRALTRSVLAALSVRIGVPLRQQPLPQALPLFANSSFVAPILTPVNALPFDDEYLGPLEAAFDSPSYLHNFSSLQLYAHRNWNELGDVTASAEYLDSAVDPPAETEFYPDSNIGFRAIAPGSGAEFSRALGGNRPREQFTIVMLTYNRDAVLAASLERLHRLPYLNKIIVIWNNIGREPVGAWPRLHVPVEFIKVPVNSLNNRFIPWDRIRTESVLSLDDDIDLKHHEIIFAFRVWRENRDRLVGFPARHHARYGDVMHYNSNHTCQLSIILTGAAFIHKSYLHAYTTRMPEAIRLHVDDVMNCEDIAMNFLVSHLSRRPPIKTTSKWTLRCPTCTETLSQDESHFQERHECIRLFTRIYGYNPLKFSQYRADSVLFKTRLPADKQKCFKYV